MLELSKSIISFIYGGTKEPGVALGGTARVAIKQAEPLRLWIIQVGIIVCTANLLSLALRKLRQPKVIAEVLGGILLGRIPGFTEKIFPEDSRGYLNLTANIGLCLFLFLVGLEIDAGVVKRNARLSVTVALAGMVLPFMLGAAFSMPLYRNFISPTVQYTHFMLFTGVAYSITAFPVLCRILTELKLLDTTVGIVVLSAGVGNDIVGWTLLAFCVALVNAGSEHVALWILLDCLAWTAFLLGPTRYALRWLAKKTGSIESGPTVFFMTATMMILLGSSFITDIIGVHAIFGAFIAGLIVPREGGLTIALTEKLEDMVAIIFLPLYFTLSGLSTDLGLLNDALTLGFTIAIMSLAFVGKFGGCTLAARYVAQFDWRESATIGSLMSCKGLVELIVLNVGLSAGILNQRVFSMFVFEALVLTFMTTPLVTSLYPSQFRVRATRSTGNEISGQALRTPGAKKLGRHPGKKQQPQVRSHEVHELGDHRTRFTVVLDKIEHLPGAMAFSQLINPLAYGFVDDGLSEILHLKDNASSRGGREPPAPSTISPISLTGSSTTHSPTINTLRLIKLTDRVSAVMKSHDTSTLLHSDPLLSVYRMFALLQGIKVSGEVVVVPEDDMSDCTIDKAHKFGAEMIVVPWIIHSSSSAANVLAANMDDWNSHPQTPTESTVLNPFEDAFKTASRYGATGSSLGTSLCSRTDMYPQSHGSRLWSFSPNASVTHSRFIRSLFARAEIDVGVYIDQSGIISTCFSDADLSFGPAAGACPLGPTRSEQLRSHIFLPFMGGSDDRFALEFVVGLCQKNEQLRATIIRFKKIEDDFGTRASISSASTRRNEEKALLAQTSKGTEVPFPPSIQDFSDTINYEHMNTEIQLRSETADDIIWARYASSRLVPLRNGGSCPASSSSPPEPPSVELLSRVTFKEITSSKPLHAALDEAYSIQRLSGSFANVGLVVVTGRSRRFAVQSFRAELTELMYEDGAGGGHGDMGEIGVVQEVRKTLGEVGSAFIGRCVGVGVWVLQASSADQGRVTSE